MIMELMVQQGRRTVRSPVRMALAAGLLLSPLLGAAVAGLPPSLGAADGFLGIVLVAGACGSDVADGTLRSTLVRPVRRWDYLLARWMGGAVMIAAVLMGKQALHVAGLAVIHGDVPRLGSLAALAASVLLTAAHLAAAMLLLSVLVTGVGDAVVVPIWLMVQQLLREFVIPVTPVLAYPTSLVSHAMPHAVEVLGMPFDEAAWVAAFTSLSLLLALLALNRRELGTGRVA